MKIKKGEKTYLGDGVYMEYDGYGYIIDTQRNRADGMVDWVYLEPELVEAMLRGMGVKPA